MTKVERPDYCCGNCPELMRGGYDCTCLGNPRCKKNKAVSLAEVLELDAQATEGPWESDVDEVSQHWSRPEPWQVIASKEVVCGDYCLGGAARGIVKTEDAELIAYYRTAAPRMAKALQEVLALHYELECHPDCCGEGFCDACGEVNPCPTMKAIYVHLGDQ